MTAATLVTISIACGMVLGWPLYTAVAYARRWRRMVDAVADTLDRLASDCYRVAALIPDGGAELHAVVVELLTTAEEAARLASALTPASPDTDQGITTPGAGASDPAPGVAPNH